MSINEQKIQCPKCGESISIDDVLTRQIEEKIKKDLQAAQQTKEQELTHKSEELKKQADEIAENKKNIDSVIADKVADQLKSEKLRIFKEARTEAEKEQSALTTLLEEQLKNKDEKLAQATKNEIELRKEKIKLEEDKQTFELEKMRQLEEAKNIFIEEASKKAAEEQQYVVAQLKKQLTNDSSTYLILFEEPEMFLHPKTAFNLRKSLYELAKDSQFQILCATHSPLMIDISKPHASLIRIIKNIDENTEAYQVNDNVFQGNSEKKQLVQMINRFNPHICEAFYADKILLVEGDTETIVYRELLSKFHPNEDIFVLNTGSKNNIPFFQEILMHFKIEHYIIHDSDTEKRNDEKNNSAWTLNQTIWQKIEEANNSKSGLARRYLHIENFESANNYQYNPDKGKPLSAYEFVQTITTDQDIPCLNWLKDIIGEKTVLHDQNFLLNTVKKS